MDCKVQNTPRKAEEFVTAFYEHSIGAICTDAKLLRIPLDDHLVHRGDGCFESLTIAESRILELDAHIARLEHSATRLGIKAPSLIRNSNKSSLILPKSAMLPMAPLNFLWDAAREVLASAQKNVPSQVFTALSPKEIPCAGLLGKRDYCLQK